MGHIWKCSHGWTLLFFVIAILRGVVTLAQLYMIKLIIDAVSSGILSEHKEEVVRHVILLVLVAGVIYLFSILIDLLGNTVRQAQQLKLRDYLFEIIHRKSNSIDLEYYENSTFHDTLHRAQMEATYRPSYILNSIAGILQNSITIVVISGLLFSLHWAVALVLLVATIPGALIRLGFSRKLYRWERARTHNERLARYFSWMITGYYYAKELRLLELGNYFITRFRELRTELRRERMSIVIRRAMFEMITHLVGALAVFGSYAFIAYRTVMGVITIGDMVMYFQAFQRGTGALRQLLGGLAGVYENNLFLHNLFEFLDLKPKIVAPANGKVIPKPLQRGINFENVSFTYPGTEIKVLEKINLKIEPGETIALVGPNGSGKTTLVKLLCRLYDPDEGKITLDDIDLREYSIENIRQEIGVLFQDFVQYHLTVRENIWFGNMDLPQDDKRIKQTAAEVGADRFIEDLPAEYDTVLGNWFEGSKQISQGEWQKIAFARSMIRDSQVLILDEPLSSLDIQAESDFQNQ